MQKHMPRALGLSLLAALGLMGLTVAGAQAEALGGVAGRILIGGADAANGTVVLGEHEGSNTLLVPALNFEIVCQKFKVLEGKVIGKGQALAKLLYEECVTWGTKKNASGEQELTTKLPCEIIEDQSPFASGGIVSQVILLVVLHEVSAGVFSTYILATGDSGAFGKEEGFLTSILVTTPSECPLPKLVEVAGSIVFKVTLGDLNSKQPEELYVLATASKALSSSGLFTDKLKYGINEAFIDGSALLWLASDANWGLI